ncbi:MAG: hypothetical protein BGP10_12435 [Rhodanobacter sp. 68-29]|nr:zinc ribbon domain-containing protein [Rhodanobacter sp.]ODV27994.1 MAG: hypothetical protein ABT19_00355 [Rhodanobacter sp. SCN 68-63]OJY60698.1 MAG: hypothetical protein BGP10_12435 [Rhodanobacter sp. 68-29]
MALIKCSECGQQMSSSAKVCPHCGKQRPSAARTGCAWIVVLFGAFIIWAIWKGGSETSGAAPTTPPAVASQAHPEPENHDDSVLRSWLYRATTDDMTGKPVQVARVESQNTVDFSFPYAGDQHATLMVRKHPRYGSDVVFSIERGQFGCSIDGCQLLVRFDDGAPERYTASEPSDRSTTSVFIVQHSRFYQRMLAAKTVRIETTFFQQGNQVFTFDVHGFDEKQFARGG